MEVSEVAPVAPSVPVRRNVLACALGRRVRGFRLVADRPQVWLAERSGLDRTEVSLIERGGREPKFGTMLKLAFALDLQASELMDGIDLDGTDHRYP